MNVWWPNKELVSRHLNCCWCSQINEVRHLPKSLLDWIFKQGQSCGKNPAEDKSGPLLWVFPGVYWQLLLPDLHPSGEDQTMGGAPSHFFNLERSSVWFNLHRDKKYKGACRLPRVSSLPLLSREGFEYIWRSPWGWERRRQEGAKTVPLLMDYPEEEMAWKDGEDCSFTLLLTTAYVLMTCELRVQVWSPWKLHLEWVSDFMWWIHMHLCSLIYKARLPF